MNDGVSARRRMIDGQVRVNDVTDARVIGAMMEVPREFFVAPDAQAEAYLDIDPPASSGGSRRLLKPLVAAKLVQAAAVAPADRALVAGSSSGYVAALLTHLAAQVFGVECDEALAGSARENLARAGLPRVQVKVGPIEEGDPANAPYDVILVNGATEVIPRALLDQLKEGGRLVAVFAEGGMREARIWRRAGGETGFRRLFSCSADVLPGLKKRSEFAF
jgi:protein-L-isoaspartate(D-aspartate) O-methyltransferase